MQRKKSSALSCSGLLTLAITGANAQSTFTNPIATSGADPFVILINGVYYYTDTTGNNVSIAESTTLPGIGTAQMNAVYTPPAGIGNVWAPEMQQINGTWYIYFAMGPSSNTNNQRTYVLQDTTSSPLGPYNYVGQINDPTNDWAIDPTVLNYNNSSYLIWSGWAGTSNVAQNLYIAQMTSPTTIGTRYLISSPQYSWEEGGAPPTVNEGPVVLSSPNGQTSIIYSASGSWTNTYCLGQLELTGSNPLLSADWTKDTSPVFSSANNVFGPGHASYTTSDNGTRDWIVYHAAVSSGSGWDRNIRTQPFSWNDDGTPSFGQPVPVTCPIQWGPVTWIGAINESGDDNVHSYTNPSNWLNGQITDSFANITLTDNTTLYFSANHTTAGDMVFTYGSGQKTLWLMSASSTAYTLSLTGNIDVNILGGTNSLYFGSASNPLSVAMGSAQRVFNIAADNSVYIDSTLTGTGGLNVSGGGILTLRGTKTYSGPTLISSGTLAAGDGGAPSGTTNLPASTVVTIGSGGTLQLNGLGTSTSNTETIAGLVGSGAVTAPSSTMQLTVANPSPGTFSGTITGTALSFFQAGPAAETFSGSATYGGSTTVTGGNLILTGSISGTSNLFVKQGFATIATGASITTTNYSSIGQAAGDAGTLNVSGSLTVPSDLNIGDVSATGVMNLSSGAFIACDTLYVGKYVTSKGTVNQTGGTVAQIGGSNDWRIGGAGSSADAAAVGVYNISSGSLNSGKSNFQIGAYGTGTLNQSGGSVVSSGYLSIGRFPGGVGYCNISAGTLTETAQPYLIVGEQGTGTLRISGTGTVSAASLSIGHNGGVGSVIQTGGTVSATSGVVFGLNPGGKGTYNLAGGTLDTSAITQGAGNGTIYFNGGDLTPTGSSATFLQGLTAADIQSGGLVFNTGIYTVTVNQPLLHDPSAPGIDGGLTKLGTGSLTIGALETYTGNTTVSAGTLAFAPNTTANVLIRTTGAITISAGATLLAGGFTKSSNAAKTLLVAQGTVSAAGTMNLGVNDLDVKNGDLASLTQLVHQGYNNGSWNGTGISSSSAANDSSRLTALGVIQNSTGSGPLYSGFDSEPVSSTDVLVKYTYYGDTNLDGKVDGSDYSRIDAGFLDGTTGWYNGDFNYDGVVNGSDYTLIDNTFNSQGPQITLQVANSTAQFAAITDTSAVPEPAGLSLVSVCAAHLGRRRQTRNPVRPLAIT